MKPTDQQVRQTLKTIEHDSKHPTRRLAMELIEAHKPWIIRTFGGHALPVDDILRKHHLDLENLIGKH